MKPLTTLTVGLFAFGLTACGNAQEPSTTAPQEAETPTQMAHDNHDMTEMEDTMGHSSGTIRSVGSQGNFLTIEHGPFEGGIDMGAMTMGFDTMGDVDLSTFAEGDEVAFMVKQGRDGSYRIKSICNIDTNGADCLNGMMDHE